MNIDKLTSICGVFVLFAIAVLLLSGAASLLKTFVFY